MVEFIVVDPAPVFPQACVCCTGTMGKMIDTHRELHPYGRVYVCMACIKRAATVIGLVSGEEADAIAAQIERLTVVERDLAAVTRARDELQTEFELLVTRYDTLDALAERRGGRIEQLEERLTERAKTDLDLLVPTARGELD